MTIQYEPLGTNRFLVEQTASGEQIRVKPPRAVFVMLFLIVWLCMWTIGGLTAIGALFHHFQPFLLFWLGGWALGLIFVSTQLVWMTVGAEILRIDQGDLEISQQILGYSIRKRFRGTDIKALTTVDQGNWSMWTNNSNLSGFGGSRRSGSIKFDYGSRTIFAASGLDEAEAKLLVDRLQKRLPPSAQVTAARR